jgi:hypothetical protein
MITMIVSVDKCNGCYVKNTVGSTDVGKTAHEIGE